MTLISFQHSVKYIYLQMAPYIALTIFTCYMATGLHLVWFFAYLAMGLISIWRLLQLSCTVYLFTHDMLIVSSGVFLKQIRCASMPQLKGMQIRHNRLLKWLWVSHIDCGMQGPPADRIRIVGVDDRTLLRALTLLNEGIDAHTAMWREHFLGATA